MRLYVLRDSLNERSGIASSLQLLGQVYENKKQYERAIDYYYQSLKILEELDDKRAIAELFTLIGENLLHIGNPDSALDYFDQSLNIAQDIGARKEEMNNYEQMAILHANKKSFNKAANYIEKYNLLKDSISIDLPDNEMEKELINSKQQSGSDILMSYKIALGVSSLIIIALIFILLFYRNRKRN